MAEKKDTKPKKLYRSESNKMLAGVCGGLAEYFDMDITLMRLLWVGLSLVGGPGVLLYIIFWLVVPTESEAKKK